MIESIAYIIIAMVMCTMFFLISFVVVAFVFYLVNIVIGFAKSQEALEKYTYLVDENGNDIVQDNRDINTTSTQ
jgi:hypothetical protein